MSLTHDIQIVVDPNTLNTLKDLGYALYVLRASNTSNAGAKALVWSAVTDFLENTEVTLGFSYQAYMQVSSEISLGVDVALGDVVTFTAGSEPTVSAGGYPQGVTVVNGGTDPQTVGLSAGNLPFVSAPLHGLGGDVFAPRDKVLVTFSTAGLRVGDVLKTSMSQSLLIDMTGRIQASASFDVNKGWSYGGADWGTVYPAAANLQPVLVKVMPLAKAV